MTAGLLGTLIVIAKEPLPGRVKTRLVPPLTHRDAAAVAEAALVDTLAAMTAVPAARHVVVLEGRPGTWLPTGWDVVAQSAGGLDARLTAAFEAVDPARSALLVGMDTPQLLARHVLAFDPSRFDACLGPATDGGYWAIGLRDPARARQVIADVPMSRADTGAQQLTRLRAAGLHVQLLDELADVDTIEVAHEVAFQAPATRFAAVLSAVAVARAAADA
ncbi:MAG: DUF2064 domain-containing protein [Actinomycetota bacterium]